MEILDNSKFDNSFIESIDDKLTRLDDNDIYALLEQLFYYEIMYQDKIGLRGNDTFGVEIEYMNGYKKNFPTRKKIYRELFSRTVCDTWSVEADGSLGENDGSELISPIMYDEKCYWDDLRRVCSYIDPISKINDLCGGHVHIGAHVLENPDSWVNFFKLWLTYENVIFKFLYGEFDCARGYLSKYAKPVKNDFIAVSELADEAINKTKFLEEIFKYLFTSRYYAVNLSGLKNPYEFAEYNTIEVRAANGSTNHIIWQNNIKFLFKLFYYANSPLFDDDLVSKRYLETSKELSFNKGDYSKIYIDQAIELADMIFDNNQDKFNFLKQYAKAFDAKQYQATKLKLIRSKKKI